MDLKDRQSNVMFMVFLNDEMRTEWRQTILIFSPPPLDIQSIQFAYQKTKTKNRNKCRMIGNVRFMPHVCDKIDETKERNV